MTQEQARDLELQRERLEYATKNGLITVYDVDFFFQKIDSLLGSTK
jgi:hypothetical protein